MGKPQDVGHEKHRPFAGDFGNHDAQRQLEGNLGALQHQMRPNRGLAEKGHAGFGHEQPGGTRVGGVVHRSEQRNVQGLERFKQTIPDCFHTTRTGLGHESFRGMHDHSFF